MRILVDGDPVIVFGRTVELAGTGELKLEPWEPSQLPVHRRGEPTQVHPCAVLVTGWPAEQVDFDIADPKLVWRIEGTWLAGNTIDFGSRTLVQDPWGRQFVMDVEDRGTPPRRNFVSPFDDAQQRELERLGMDGAVLVTRRRRDVLGEKIWEIVAFDPEEVSRALSLRPDQRVSVVAAEWCADSVRRTRQAIGELSDQGLLASGEGVGADGGPFAFTLRVCWLDPNLLALYRATLAGLLALDVWLGPAADNRSTA